MDNASDDLNPAACAKHIDDARIILTDYSPNCTGTYAGLLGALRHFSNGLEIAGKQADPQKAAGILCMEMNLTNLVGVLATTGAVLQVIEKCDPNLPTDQSSLNKAHINITSRDLLASMSYLKKAIDSLEKPLPRSKQPLDAFAARTSQGGIHAVFSAAHQRFKSRNDLKAQPMETQHVFIREIRKTFHDGLNVTFNIFGDARVMGYIQR